MQQNKDLEIDNLNTNKISIPSHSRSRKKISDGAKFESDIKINNKIEKELVLSS